MELLLTGYPDICICSFLVIAETVFSSTGRRSLFVSDNTPGLECRTYYRTVLRLANGNFILTFHDCMGKHATPMFESSQSPNAIWWTSGKQFGRIMKMFNSLYERPVHL